MFEKGDKVKIQTDDIDAEYYNGRTGRVMRVEGKGSFFNDLVRVKFEPSFTVGNKKFTEEIFKPEELIKI